MQYSKRYIKSLASSIVITFVVLAAIISPAYAQSTRLSDAELAAAVNEMLEKTYKPDEPGAAVIVVRDGKVVFRKGYGKANVELGVPVEPDMIFRTGSITKQFTARQY